MERRPPLSAPLVARETGVTGATPDGLAWRETPAGARAVGAVLIAPDADDRRHGAARLGTGRDGR